MIIIITFVVIIIFLYSHCVRIAWVQTQSIIIILCIYNQVIKI